MNSKKSHLSEFSAALRERSADRICLRLFIRLAGALLLALALASLLDAAVNPELLSLREPLLQVPMRSAVWGAAGLELVVALVCLFGKQAGIATAFILWLSTDFLVYRIGLRWQGCNTQWGCLGNAMNNLPLLPGADYGGINSLTGLLFLGSFAGTIWLWLLGREARAALTPKMFCPNCGGHIQFAIQDLGRKIPCPLCRTTLTLRAPENLKMSCSFCQRHIEFPVHALGQKISCPHCKMTVILKEPT